MSAAAWGGAPSTASEPPNVLLHNYENFLHRTPIVTRYVLTALSATYVLSFLWDPTPALSCVPYHTVFRFQLYRLVTSSLLCTNALSLLFAFLSFADTGRRMEHGLGSAAMGALVLTLSVLVHASSVVLSLIVAYGLSRNRTTIAAPDSSGFWPVLLAVISIECSAAPIDATRRLLGSYDISTRHYPLLLLGLFTLLGGGFHLPYGLGVAVGYAYGWGKLDRFKPGLDRLEQWESSRGVLRNFAARQGWVAGHAASGSNAWALPSSASISAPAGGGGGWSPAAFFQGQQQHHPPEGSDGGSGGGGGSGPGQVSSPAGFPTSGGRALGDGQSGGGGASNTGRAKQRSSAAAVAEAAERRAKASAAAAARLAANASDDV